ncbi:hypothetical protein ULG90_24925 [Halopseudomonas pachastrellae]|nr:hypothetical protein ULG90_24925 [Halopseudomonas pachastrellae]
MRVHRLAVNVDTDGLLKVGAVAVNVRRQPSAKRGGAVVVRFQRLARQA